MGFLSRSKVLYADTKFPSTMSGYTTAQLIAAINDTASIPILTVAEISQTLFHCTDILGTITGNSYCFAGCDSKAGTRNDQCIM